MTRLPRRPGFCSTSLQSVAFIAAVIVSLIASTQLSASSDGAFQSSTTQKPAPEKETTAQLEARLLTPVTPAANRLPDIPDFVRQIGFETGIPLPRQPGQSLVLTADLSFYGKKNHYRLHAGGFASPGSRMGESAFLFGSRIGVRPNPRLSLDTGVTYVF